MPTPLFPHLDSCREVREAVRAVCSKYPAEYWEQHDRDHEYAAEFVRDFADAGFLGMVIPEEYGGGGGTVADFCAALEEVAACSSVPKSSGASSCPRSLRARCW
jgi:acyl-CoA dehydrogenase